MADDWMSIMVELPANEGEALLAFLRGEMDFTEVDWCELQRPDRARATYAPSPPRTESGFTIDPFPA